MFAGRILNRFSKDMGSMDELLPPAFFDVGFAPDESNKRAISNKPRLIAIKGGKISRLNLLGPKLG